jgi:hypothetical protein
MHFAAPSESLTFLITLVLILLNLFVVLMMKAPTNFTWHPQHFMDTSFTTSRCLQRGLLAHRHEGTFEVQI